MLGSKFSCRMVSQLEGTRAGYAELHFIEERDFYHLSLSFSQGLLTIILAHTTVATDFTRPKTIHNYIAQK